MEDNYLPMKLNIAFIGYNELLSNKGLKQFIDDNTEQIEKVLMSTYGSIVYLKDGTMIRTVSLSNNSIRGYKFDQYILFDDSRWLIESEKESEIQLLIARSSLHRVPEEFQILKYKERK